MFASKLKTVLLTALLAMSAAAAQADVITFEGIAAQNSLTFLAPSAVPLTGYSLASTPDTNAVFDSAFWSGVSAFSSDGTSFLAVTDRATLTSSADSLFSVSSIDLGNYMNGTSATLTGTFANGTTISTAYSLNNSNILSANDFTTELLSGFTDLKSFTIINSGGIAVSVDNIVLNQSAAATTDVPEPASLAILGLGLVGLGVARRRKSA